MFICITFLNSYKILLKDFNPALQNLITLWLFVMITISFICFVVSEITRNYSQVDKIWSLMPITYGVITLTTFPSTRLVIMTLLVTIWGLRLSYNFYRKGGYNIIPWKGSEDYRWKMLREQPFLRSRLMFGLFNMIFISFYQNILILLFSSPFLIAASYPDVSLKVTDLLAAVFMLLFIVTEMIADNQQYRFHLEKQKLNKDAKRYTESLKKGFLSEGIWKYVRHPNFISEQCIWISFYFFGIAASGEWINITIAGPVLLVLLFTGSTWLTEHISKSKYPEYTTYRKQVPKFIPRLFSVKQ